MIIQLRNQRNRSLLLLGILCLAALGLEAWQRVAQRAGGAMWLDQLVCTAASPVQGVLLRASRGTEGAWLMLAGSRRLARENARLSQEVAALGARLDRLQERSAGLRRESVLRAAYPAANRPGRIAHIIGVTADGWESYLVLDRGSSQGVRVRDVAVARDGLVGQVYAVASHSARVLPITDPASGVAVRVQRSREAGIVKGAGEWRCELRYLGPQAQVRAGDTLLSAGTGGVFPKGLRVGTVVSVSSDASTSGKMAAVAPAVRMQEVEEVLLLPRSGPSG
jgi:rod shape-determining protein MreC